MTSSSFLNMNKTVSKKCSDIDLEIHPDKCVSVAYNGSKVMKTCSFPIGEGHARYLSSDAAVSRATQ